MQFRLLGPLRVAEQNMAAALGGVKQRSSLAILVILRLEELRLAALAPDDSGTRFRSSLTGAGS